jgi:hypothetical protein
VACVWHELPAVHVTINVPCLVCIGRGGAGEGFCSAAGIRIHGGGQEVIVALPAVALIPAGIRALRACCASMRHAGVPCIAGDVPASWGMRGA